MSNILFLDDDKGRHSWFKSAIGFNADFVFTADECIAALRSKKYDIISLDHDLTGEIYVDQSRKDCGMEVVRFLEENPISVKSAERFVK